MIANTITPQRDGDKAGCKHIEAGPRRRGVRVGEIGEAAGGRHITNTLALAMPRFISSINASVHPISALSNQTLHSSRSCSMFLMRWQHSPVPSPLYVWFINMRGLRGRISLSFRLWLGMTKSLALADRTSNRLFWFSELLNSAQSSFLGLQPPSAADDVKGSQHS